MYELTSKMVGEKLSVDTISKEKIVSGGYIQRTSDNKIISKTQQNHERAKKMKKIAVVFLKLLLTQETKNLISSASVRHLQSEEKVFIKNQILEAYRNYSSLFMLSEIGLGECLQESNSIQELETYLLQPVPLLLSNIEINIDSTEPLKTLISYQLELEKSSGFLKTINIPKKIEALSCISGLSAAYVAKINLDLLALLRPDLVEEKECELTPQG